MSVHTPLSLRARRAWQSFLRTSHNNRKGFTLVELLVVISIIAILSVIGITVFTGVQKGARDAKRRGDIDAIAKALEIYKSVNGVYPSTGAVWWYSNSTSWSGLDVLVPNYISKVPIDPKNSVGNIYYYYSDPQYASNTAGTYFMLAAGLESPTDNDKKTGCVFPNKINAVGGENAVFSGVTQTWHMGTAPIANLWVCSQQ